MINEERVILMTRLAAFQQREGKQNAAINQYFRSDYVGYQILKSIIGSTIVFVIVAGIYALLRFEHVIQDIYNMNLAAVVGKLLVFYILLVGILALVTYFVYTRRYNRMRRRMREYYEDLRELSGLYENSQREW